VRLKLGPASTAARPRRRASLAWVAVAAALAHSAHASAQVVVEIEGDCADRDDLIQAVESAVGLDTELDVAIAITCGAIIAARVDVARGAALAHRALAIADTERADLAAAIALSAAIAADEVASAVVAPPAMAVEITVESTAVPEPTPPEAISAPAPAPEAEPEAEPASTTDLVLRGGAIAFLAPLVVPTLGLGAAMRWGPVFSAEVEAMGVLPIASPVAGGSVQIAALGGRAAACADGRIAVVELGGCIGAWGGGLYGEPSGFRTASASWAPWAALDGRVRATLVLDAFFLRAEVALVALLAAPTFVVDVADQAVPISRSGPVAGWAGIAIGVRFAP
jgi:hypothetical protein